MEHSVLLISSLSTRFHLLERTDTRLPIIWHVVLRSGKMYIELISSYQTPFQLLMSTLKGHINTCRACNKAIFLWVYNSSSLWRLGLSRVLDVKFEKVVCSQFLRVRSTVYALDNVMMFTESVLWVHIYACGINQFSIFNIHRPWSLCVLTLVLIEMSWINIQ